MEHFDSMVQAIIWLNYNHACTCTVAIRGNVYCWMKDMCDDRMILHRVYPTSFYLRSGGDNAIRPAAVEKRS